MERKKILKAVQGVLDTLDSEHYTYKIVAVPKIYKDGDTLPIKLHGEELKLGDQSILNKEEQRKLEVEIGIHSN